MSRARSEERARKPGQLLAGLMVAWLAIGAHPAHAGDQHGHDGHAMEAAEPAGSHTVRGIFLGYDEAEHRVTIAHEAVPEVMMAMRMHFALPEGEPAPALAPGDKVTFEMWRRTEVGPRWHARELEALPDTTEILLPPGLRDQVGH